MDDYNAPDQYSKSLLNEAGFGIRRLDILQQRINQVRANLLAWNNEILAYNYQIYFSDLCSLLNECWAKLTDTEQDDIKVIKKIIQDRFELFPPHKSFTKASSNMKETQVIKKNWNELEMLLDIFEKSIRTSMDNHGLTNPDMEGDLF